MAKFINRGTYFDFLLFLAFFLQFFLTVDLKFKVIFVWNIYLKTIPITSIPENLQILLNDTFSINQNLSISNQKIKSRLYRSSVHDSI